MTVIFDISRKLENKNRRKGNQTKKKFNFQHFNYDQHKKKTKSV